MKWLVFTYDGDFDNVVEAEDDESALRAAVEAGTEEPSVRPLTAADERAMLATERREERAAKRALWTKQADVCDPPLSMMAWLTVCTEHGYRCPGCGRFCRQSAFSQSPSEVRVAGAIVFVGPRCKRCRGLA